MNTLTAYLFAQPSFLGGVASTLDLGGTLNSYNSALLPEQADSLALASDWAMVGFDLRGAIQHYILERIAELEGNDVGQTADGPVADNAGSDPRRREVGEVVG